MLLVEQGTNKNEVGGSYEDTALSAAAKNNYLAVVQHLVEQGAEADKANTKGSHLTPLHYASMRGHLEVVRYLLEQGQDRQEPLDSPPLCCYLRSSRDSQAAHGLWSGLNCGERPRSVADRCGSHRGDQTGHPRRAQTPPGPRPQASHRARPTPQCSRTSFRTARGTRSG